LSTADTGALRNHGNSLNGTNNSSPPRRSQKPCHEIFVTSTAEVLSPSDPDFIDAFLDYLPRESQLALVQTIVPREIDGRFDPELRFSTFALHVNMHTFFFTGEEQKPKSPLAENCWTHGPLIPL